ncbi:hypothetical protein CTV95_05530 [Pectobacterium brasiliense]|nr:hypothetical protein CTV95_05530 [Pectobacterium brasiliense]
MRHGWRNPSVQGCIYSVFTIYLSSSSSGLCQHPQPVIDRPKMEEAWITVYLRLLPVLFVMVGCILIKRNWN